MRAQLVLTLILLVLGWRRPGGLRFEVSADCNEGDRTLALPDTLSGCSQMLRPCSGSLVWHIQCQPGVRACIDSVTHEFSCAVGLGLLDPAA